MQASIKVLPIAVVLNIISAKKYSVFLNEALYICSDFQLLIKVYFTYNRISKFESFTIVNIQRYTKSRIFHDTWL